VNPTEIALIVFACVFASALLGMFLRAVLPEHHLNEDSRTVIKHGLELIATIVALVLGLLIATAKNSHETQDAAIKHSATKIMLLDHVLVQYGPETKGIRDLIRRVLAERIDEVWPEECSQPVKLNRSEISPAPERIDGGIWELTPRNDAQRGLQLRALQLDSDLMEAQWVVGSMGSSVPVPFLLILVFWLTFIFGCFGIFAPRNATIIAVLFVCALSIAGSIFLILEMDQPFSGVMKISSSPLRYAISHLSQ